MKLLKSSKLSDRHKKMFLNTSCYRFPISLYLKTINILLDRTGNKLNPKLPR